MPKKWSKPLPEHSPVPLWFQISERLRTAIKEGQFSAGDTLPSEAHLNRTFGVSRATSRSALDHLERDGLITRRSGKGSMVISPRVDQPANEMAGFAESMRHRGLRPSYETRFVGSVAATAEVAEALAVEAGSPVYQSKRLLMADGLPIGFAVSWLSPHLFRNVEPPTVAELDRASLYEWLAGQCGVKITATREFIEAAIVEKGMGDELSAKPGSAVLIARRLSRGADGLPVEYAVLHFRADRYRFHLEVNR